METMKIKYEMCTQTDNNKTYAGRSRRRQVVDSERRQQRPKTPAYRVCVTNVGSIHSLPIIFPTTRVTKKTRETSGLYTTFHCD